MGCAQSQDDQNSLNLTKPYVYFVTGGPGSGKGTQSQLLVRDYRFKHISVGDLLRQQQKKGGPLASQLKKQMEQGKLISSEMVVRLLKKSFAKNGNRRYLIDGFPRNTENIEKFMEMMKDQVVIKFFIFFNCSNEILTQRLLKRAQISGRVDDNPQTIKKRISTYENQSLPVIRKFQQQDKIIEINAEKSKQQVYDQLKSKLDQNRVYPPTTASIIFVLGGPGSGKGTQCQILVKQYGFRHLSTGDLLRQSVKNGSPKGKQIEVCMKQGKLVSSELLVQLIQQNLQRYNFYGRYLLDGFPRGQQNIDAWNKILDKWSNLKGILYFKCEQKQLIQRLLNRAKTSGRVDDNQETIKKRINVFNNQTSPVIDTYAKQGKVIEIDAMKSIQQVADNVKQQLANIGINPRQRSNNYPKVICVLGGPGSGKGTQCENMKKQFKFKHLSTGDLLREQKQHNGLYAQLIQQYTTNGKLVPSQILVLLIKKKLSNFHKEDIFLLDGFPRNQQNIDKWQEILGIDLEFEHVIYFECSEKAMEQRLANRGKTSGRSDDNTQTIKKRLNVFQQQTVPIIKKLSKKQNFVISINAEGSPENVYKCLKQKLIDIGYKN